MKTLRRLIHREVLQAVTLVTLAFLGLFFLFDLLEELRSVGRIPGFTTTFAIINVVLTLPSHLYELLPIAVLIGTIFVMTRWAQSSEFTIMRTSGLGPWQALGTLTGVGAVFVVVTVLIGDYLVPAAERASIAAHAKYLNLPAFSRAGGAWLKERTASGEMVAVNVSSANAQGDLERVRIFTFDATGRMREHIQASSGHITAHEGKSLWQLHNARRSVWTYSDGASSTNSAVLPQTPSSLHADLGRGSLSSAAPLAHSVNVAQLQRSQSSDFAWPSTISSDMLLAAVRRPDRMLTLELWRFIQHLKNNAQSAQSYEISFWRKVFYPLSCLVMVVLALPFAYVHFRSGGMAAQVFGGVMAGISFFLLNNVFGYVGNLSNWPPALTAAAPALLYSMVSLGAFGWLVLRR